MAPDSVDETPDYEQDDTPSDVESHGAPHWRRTVWSVWFAHLLAAVGFSFVMPFLPFFVRDLGVADERLVGAWAGIAMFAAGLSLTIFQPLWGSLADRYGRKIMLQRAMLGGAVTIALIGFTQTVGQLVALRFLQGALTGTGAACNTLVASVTPRKQLGFAMGLMQTALIVGNSLGPWLGGITADSFGYRVPFFMCGGMWAVAWVVVTVGAREKFVRPEKGTGENHGLRQAFGNGGMTALLGAFFLSAFAMTFVGPIFPLFVEQVADTTRAATVTGQLMGIGGLAAGIACLVVGRLSDRIGHRRVLITASLGSALFSAPNAIAQTIAQLFGLRIGWGLIAGGAGPAMNAMIGSNVSADTFGRTFGMTTSAMCFGFALGPLAGGLLSTTIGLRWPFVVMAAFQLATAVLIWGYVKPNGRAREDSDSETPLAAK